MLGATKGNAKVKRALLPLIASAALCGSAANAADTLASSPAADSDGMQKVANRELVSAPNTFEFDDIAVQAIPEPAIWMMLILGTVGAGFAMRRPASESIVRVRYL